jgi:cytoskeleton protein RodZ
MTATTLEEILEPAISEVGSPGRRLREGREARRWTQEDVGLQLRLAPGVIAALERDDYSNLPPPAYVRGYLRSYAHLLDMPESMVSEAYQRLQITLPGRELELPKAARQATSRDRRVRWVTYLIVLALIGLPLIWWQTQGSFRFWEVFPSVSPSGAKNATPAPEPKPAPTSRSETAAQTASVPQGDVFPVAAPPTTTEPPAAVSPVPPVDSGEGAAVETAEMGSEGETGSEVTASVPAATVAEPKPPAEAGPQAAAAAPGASQPGIRPDQLVLKARADSWVSVVDADRRRLAYRVLAAGSEQTLKGRAPFQVVLGNADGVSVDYNGKAVDPQRYARSGVARFEVGSGHE